MQVSVQPLDAGIVQMVSLMINAFGLLAIIGTAVKVSSLLATLVAKIDYLGKVPPKVEVLERQVAVIEKDVNNLWQAFRSDCSERAKEREEDFEREQERLERILNAWEKKGS